MEDPDDFEGSKSPWDPPALNQECFDECCTNKISSFSLKPKGYLYILTELNILLKKSQEHIFLFSPSFSKPSRIKSVPFIKVANFQGSLVLLLLLSSQLLVSGAAATSVYLTPNSVYAVGKRATFICNAANCVGVQWLLNRTHLYSLNHTNCRSAFYEDTGTGVLIVDPISLEYNETTIQCEARFSSNTTSLSDNRIILIQGILSPVANLTYISLNSTIKLSWQAPFSLDIPDVDPDITYCVDIYNSTSSSLIDSRCGINITQYVYMSLPNLLACTGYRVKITAVNSVGNSTATTLSIIWKNRLNVTDVSASSLPDSKNIVRINMLHYLCYTSVSVDINGVAIPSLQERFVQPNIIELFLNDNTQYKIIIHDQSSDRFTFNISTHDVETVQTRVIASNTVDLNSTFITNSFAQGVLYVLININTKGNVNFTRSKYLPVARDNATKGIEVPKISQGNYSVLAYDIEEDGSLQERGLPAATTNMIYIPGETIDNNQPGGDCVVDNSTGFNINVTCYCQENTSYQVMLQRNDGTLESVESIIATRSHCSQSVVFEVLTNGIYCATVFHEEDENGIFGTKIYFAMEFGVYHLSTRDPNTATMSSDHNESSSSLITGGIVGALFGFFIMSVTVSTMVVSIFCVRKKEKKKSTSITNDNQVHDEQHKVIPYSTLELGTFNYFTKETCALPPPLYISSPSEGPQPPELPPPYIPYSLNDDFQPPILPAPQNSSADNNIPELNDIDSAAQTPESPLHYQSEVETLEEIVEERDMATPVKAVMTSDKAEGHYTVVTPKTATYYDSGPPVGFTTVQYDEITGHINKGQMYVHVNMPSDTGLHRAVGDYNADPYSRVVSLKPPAAVKDHTTGAAECVSSDNKDGATVGEILCENLDNDHFTTDVDENISNVAQESDDTNFGCQDSI